MLFLLITHLQDLQFNKCQIKLEFMDLRLFIRQTFVKVLGSQWFLQQSHNVRWKMG